MINLGLLLSFLYLPTNDDLGMNLVVRFKSN